MNYLAREGAKLREKTDETWQTLRENPALTKHAEKALGDLETLDEEADFSKLTPGDMLLWVEEIRKCDKVLKQKLERKESIIKEQKKEMKEMNEKLKDAEKKLEKGVERECWSAEECLAFKTANQLSFNKYHDLRLQIGAPLLPKNYVMEEEKSITSHMTLIPVIENGDINRGFVADLRQLIIDAIKSGKFELVPGDNDLKLTGDGGGLHKARPMAALFVQSLMRTSGAQSLDAIQPIAILLQKESYESVALACQILNPMIDRLEEEGVDVDGKHYDFEFYFASDLKFMWIVRSLGYLGRFSLRSHSISLLS